MKEAISFFSLFFLFAGAFAQDLSGTWEGELRLNDDKDHILKVEMEMLSDVNGNLLAIIYTRGFESNTVFGCDYIMNGQVDKGNFRLGMQKLQRNFNISPANCIYLDNIRATLSLEDSVRWIRGNWISGTGPRSRFFCHKVSDELSENGKDELAAYMDEIYKKLDETEVYLSPSERQNEKVAAYVSDSAEINFDISAKTVTGNDSVAVLLNGDTIINNYNLSVKALRIRFTMADDQPNELVIINQSKRVKSLDLSARIIEAGIEKAGYLCQPGFTRNAVFFIRRKKNQ